MLYDGTGLVAKRLAAGSHHFEQPLYKPYEGSGEEVNILARIHWFAREM